MNWAMNADIDIRSPSIDLLKYGMLAQGIQPKRIPFLYRQIERLTATKNTTLW
jgi:hypothetical protein